MTNSDLRRLRRHLKLTQVQLAAALGVTPMTVARWEQGTYPIPPLGVAVFTLLAADPGAVSTLSPIRTSPPAPAPRRARSSSTTSSARAAKEAG
jgi:transcriptional regulator with XRE-family HTH domain